MSMSFAYSLERTRQRPTLFPSATRENQRKRSGKVRRDDFCEFPIELMNDYRNENLLLEKTNRQLVTIV